MTSTSATWTGGGAGAVGVGGGLTWGCFANITSAEAWVSPSEVRAWVAFFVLPVLHGTASTSGIGCPQGLSSYLLGLPPALGESALLP